MCNLIYQHMCRIITIPIIIVLCRHYRNTSIFLHPYLIFIFTPHQVDLRQDLKRREQQYENNRGIRVDGLN